MAMNQGDLDEIAARLKSGKSFNLIRCAAESVLRAMIEAEAAAKIGA